MASMIFTLRYSIMTSWIQSALSQDIMVLGDSYARKSFDYLETYCPGKSIRNMGVDNALASEWSKGSCPSKGVCSAHDVFNVGSGYKYAWLSVGGNDFIDEGCINWFGELASSIRNAIEAVQAAAPGIKILMTGYCIPPAPLTAFVCHDASDIANLNGAIKRACESMSVCTFVDATGACGGSSSTYSNSRYFADSIHPNEQGYRHIFSMPRVQSFFGCEKANSICFDARYPYYRNVDGYAVCYSKASLAHGGGGPCNSWCVTDVAAGDHCNGCCGDMQQRLCGFSMLASIPSTTSSFKPASVLRNPPRTSSRHACIDARYPYYRKVDGFAVCYSKASFAHRGGGPCNSWCVTDVAASDHCNGCCGDMRQRLCRSSMFTSILSTTSSFLLAGALRHHPSTSSRSTSETRPTVALQILNKAFMSEHVPRSTSSRNTSNDHPIILVSVGNHTFTVQDPQSAKWVLLAGAFAGICGMGIANKFERSSGVNQVDQVEVVELVAIE